MVMSLHKMAIKHQKLVIGLYDISWIHEFRDSNLPIGISYHRYIGNTFTDVLRLPDYFTIHNSLVLRGSVISALPKGLVILGYFECVDNKNLNALPPDLVVGKTLFLDGFVGDTIPETISVGSNVNIISSKITTLPDNLTINGWLNLLSTPIREYPKNLTVHGDLLLVGTDICDGELPPDVVVHGDVTRAAVGVKE